jgi:hypothetical protein
MLEDGEWHSIEELRVCLPDELSNNVGVHISRMREFYRDSNRCIVHEDGYYRVARYFRKVR